MAIKKVQLKDASLQNVLHPETDWSVIQNIPTDLGKVKKVNNQTPGTDGNVTVTAEHITYSGSTTVKTGIDNAASAASTAQSTANSASSAASTADGKAVAAQTTANTAVTNAATAQQKANDAYDLALGKNQSVVTEDVAKTYNFLAASSTAMNTGDNIFINYLDVCDLWALGHGALLNQSGTYYFVLTIGGTETRIRVTIVSNATEFDNWIRGSTGTAMYPAAVKIGTSTNYNVVNKLETQKTTVTVPLPSDTAPNNVGTASAGSSVYYSRADHKHGISVTQGSSNGQITIAGHTVTPKGLDTAAYKAESYFAKATDLSTTNTNLGNLSADVENVESDIADLSSTVSLLSTNKQDKSLSTTIAGASTVEGALTNLNNAVGSGVYYTEIT